jgi:endoglucanase
MSKAAKLSIFVTLALLTVVMFESGCRSRRQTEEPNTAGKPADVFAVNKLIGRGINLGNALDAPKEGEWGVTLQEEYFQVMKDAGFNSVRLPVRWSAHCANGPPYTIDPNFFKRVDWAVNCALSRNLPVILDVHHYEEIYSDPNGQKAKFLALWKQISEHYKDYAGTLVFELLNEPRGNLKVAEWNALLAEAITVIRQSSPDRAIAVAPVNPNRVDNLKFLELPENDRNIIVTIHYYLPMEFTHQGLPWLPQAKAWAGTKWTGSDGEKQAIVKDFDVAAAWAKQRNRPINLGEFGSYKGADTESRTRWTKFVADTATERGFSFDYWEFCADFGLYDRQAKSWHKELVDAVIPPK